MRALIEKNRDGMPDSVKKQLGIMIAGFLPAFIAAGTTRDAQIAYLSALSIALAGYDECDAVAGIEACKRLRRPPTVGDLHAAMPQREITPERIEEIISQARAAAAEKRLTLTEQVRRRASFAVLPSDLTIS